MEVNIRRYLQIIDISEEKKYQLIGFRSLVGQTSVQIRPLNFLATVQTKLLAYH